MSQSYLENKVREIINEIAEIQDHPSLGASQRAALISARLLVMSSQHPGHTKQSEKTRLGFIDSAMSQLIAEDLDRVSTLRLVNKLNGNCWSIATCDAGYRVELFDAPERGESPRGSWVDFDLLKAINCALSGNRIDE